MCRSKSSAMIGVGLPLLMAVFFNAVSTGCAVKPRSITLPAEVIAIPAHDSSDKNGLVQGETNVLANDILGAPDLRPTCYDDGDCCPGSCDAHFVVNAVENGTSRVHSPGSSNAHWKPCKNGQVCELCLGSDPADCFILMYRGSGPDPGRVDFTTRFWEMACQLEELPNAIETECNGIRKASALLGQVSCLKTPSAKGCDGLAPTADRIASERAKVNRCLTRRNGDWRCYYGGPGRTLSPGACERATVNRDGWDCCNGDPVHDACVTGCEKYYIDPPELH